VVGLWEFDPETSTIAWNSFIKRNQRLEAAVKRTEEYVAEQLVSCI
jgi:hypothetical protein